MDIRGHELEEYALVISMLPDVVFVLTESGRYAAIFGGENATFYHDGSVLEGLSLFEALPQSKAQWFLDRIHETLAKDKLMVFDYSLSADEVLGIDNHSGPNGVIRFEGRVNPLHSLRYNERAVVWVARNITQRYQLEQQLLHQSQIDALSEAYNRRHLFQLLGDAFYAYQRYQDNVGFILIDIDDFKQVNDRYGHQAGDYAICSLVECCQQELRQGDVIGRIGGDEFAIIHKCRYPRSSYALAERLQDALQAQRLTIEHHAFHLSMSIGISHFVSTDLNEQAVYQRADLALYKSKHKGKCCISCQDAEPLAGPRQAPRESVD